ncbi:isocitrate/isopropylmalate dehydrogenase family protein [Desulfovibrio litoralis]|uniref:3-isopropylmalate dehydrogenase n=1 Tax=Desulfovibrio litoralis DSM 11393 TaxID=1121455 RepID=A0A1M7T1E6_9BACT|nr:isocitrate/isopropylmalate dehydrogenase family protein [Desulfovibrio litoralis]SHN64528.1 3-isopropylmalate dehydrogenase [Desulfovibrio litoralis DSM 11393]
MKQYNIAYLPGDGIGPEVSAEAHKVLAKVSSDYGFSLKWVEFPYGATHYLKTGELLSQSALTEMADCSAMMLGAVGDPKVKPGVLEQGILLALRFHFDQYINLRPAVSFPNVPLPIALPKGEQINCVVVRENTEDFYMGIGGRGRKNFQVPLHAKRALYDFNATLDVKLDQDIEMAIQLGAISRPGIERVTRFGCELAKKRGEKNVALVSKSNAVPHIYGFLDEVTKEVVAKEYPDLTLSVVNVDALCYHLARKPQGWGVMICPNLFGDIVSDLLAGLAGGLGVAAAGNIGDGLSMFEPIHGSAPDIAGTGKANPIAAILSAAMMLQHVGEDKAAAVIEDAVKAYLADAKLPQMPIEFGGSASCSNVGDMVLARIK